MAIDINESLLFIAAIGSGLIFASHFVIIGIGVPAYRYLNMGDKYVKMGQEKPIRMALFVLLLGLPFLTIGGLILAASFYGENVPFVYWLAVAATGLYALRSAHTIQQYYEGNMRLIDVVVGIVFFSLTIIQVVALTWEWIK